MATVYPNNIDGYQSLPILIDGISAVRADDVNRVRNATVAVESELGINPSGTFGTVRARLDALEANGGNGATVSDYISGQIEQPDPSVTYRIIINSPFSGTMVTVTTLASSGSCNLTVRINGVPLDGSSNSVSNVEDIQHHVADNRFSIGDEVDLQITNNNSTENLSFLIDIIRNEVALNSVPSSSVDTAQNIGLQGFGLFKQKNTDVLQFRNIAAGSNLITVALDDPNNDVTIDVAEGNLNLNSIGGVLGVSQGGTGKTTASTAFTNLSPLKTKGDVLGTDGTTNQALAIGNDTYILTANSAAPLGFSWMPPSGALAISTVSTNYSLTTADRTILVDASSGPIMITLPIASNAIKGTIYKIKKIDATSNTVTLSASGGQTVDGQPTYIIYSQYFDVEVQTDGNNWFVV